MDTRNVGLVTVGVAVLGSAMAAITGAKGARVATMQGMVELIAAAVRLRWARPEAPASMRKEVCHA